MTAEEFTEHNRLTAKLQVGMKMTAFIIECIGVKMFYNKLPVSNTFGLTLDYTYPNFSEDIEYIDSTLLDKSSCMKLYL